MRRGCYVSYLTKIKLCLNFGKIEFILIFYAIEYLKKILLMYLTC